MLEILECPLTNAQFAIPVTTIRKFCPGRAYLYSVRFVRLTTIDNSYEANFLKEDLDQAGIPCFLTNENITNLIPSTFGLLGSGIQVMVAEEELGKAKEVLALR